MLMNVSVDYLISDAEFEEDSNYIKSIIKRGFSFSQRQVKDIWGETQPNLNETENRLVRLT